jgi:serine/threonine-protein kinase RsbW
MVPLSPVPAPAGDARIVLEIEVPSDVGLIEQIVSLVSRKVRELDFPREACTFNVPVALREALSNAMLRGNGDDRAKHVRLRAWLCGPQLVLDVADEGRGFDIERCTCDPTAADNLLRENGRGLFLMQRLMDRVERLPADSVAAAPAAGNVVRLTLRRR